jgi:hydrogenase maturation protein HypF
MKSTVPDQARLKACVHGAVQGVGFRPFIFRLASELRLTGWVSNTVQGVFLEVEGPRVELEKFLLRVETDKPPRSFIQSLEASWLDPVGYAGFEIRQSESAGSKTALVLPDIATCPDCLAEIFDPDNRRYLYPFTNCTNCGPRFSIIESLPYDRTNTSMKIFRMCARCQAEYDDPRDRRFHAQPNACPDCGPHLELWRGCAHESAADPSPHSSQPRPEERGYQALLTAADALRRGKIAAVKGLGGFHLMADARNAEAVRRLRERKHREEKPFALMFSSLESVKAVCEVSPQEERLLRSPEAPIVLLRRRSKSQISKLKFEIAEGIAPRNPDLGVMLPYTPLHHLLMSVLGFPVVATSGNLSDEPICIDEREALERLGEIADLFLVHNRPIVRHVDDSIARVMLGRQLVLRRARGYAPLPVTLRPQLSTLNSQPVLAVGAHLKNTVALCIGSQVLISQHIGDLETDEAFEAFRRVIADFEKLYETKPNIIAADLHPDYLSTKYARELVRDALLRVPAEQPLGPPIAQASLSGRAGCPQPAGSAIRTSRPTLVGVQHHVAHVLSCMAENELEPPALGVSWDGTGYGLDGTIWGGEFFLVSDTVCQRAAHLRPFRLPGGDKAVKEPRRTALGLLYELFGDALFSESAPPELLRGVPGSPRSASTLRRASEDRGAPLDAFSASEIATLKNMLKRGLNSPLTSSVGRLFDAVAALTGLRQRTHFEGQAAMELEFALEGINTEEGYPMPIADSRLPIEMASGEAASSPRIRDRGSRTTDHASLMLDWSPMIKAMLADLNSGVPTGLISARFHNALAEMVVAVARYCGQERVVLSGGCFQNRYLTERIVRRLQMAEFRPYWHQRVPPNDGGIALGQIIAAMREGS